MDNVRLFIDFIWKLYKAKFYGDFVIKFTNGIPVLVRELNRDIRITDLKDCQLIKI